MKTICSSCGRNLEDIGENFILCSVCGKFSPRGANSYKKRMKGGTRNMVKSDNKTKDYNPEKYLKCDVCGKYKRAGPKRIAKWKGKKYLCRECRPKTKSKKNGKK